MENDAQVVVQQAENIQLSKLPITVIQTAEENQIDAAVPLDEIIQIPDENQIGIAAAVVPPKTNDLYKQLLSLEEDDGLVINLEPFDCEICTNSIELNDGIVLRNCLHKFCKECVHQTIMMSEDVEIKCPYYEKNGICEGQLQDREIRAILPTEDYDKFLIRGLRFARSTIKGTVLCNALNCEGWCICDEEINEFTCPQCSKKNCVPCKAIHTGRNCKEYQDDLAAGDAEGLHSEIRRSASVIEDLIKNEQAMKCPNCQILIMKRDGCDWLICAMCKTEICWVTKGARWGPSGRGDNSGGCRCLVNGTKCHPQCGNCH